MTPSVSQMAGNDSAARIPPSAGPTDMPRFTAARCSANAGLVNSGGTDSLTAVMFAGRNDSLASDQQTVSATTAGKVETSGNRHMKTPARVRDSVITRRVPRKSQRRPEVGAAIRATAP